MAKRRVQPRRTSRGQHSKYGKDFVVGKLKIEIKTDGDDTVSKMNDGNKKQTQTDIHIRAKPVGALKPAGSGRGRGRPKKVKVDDADNVQKVDSVNGSEKEPDLSLKIPTKTYDKKTNAAKSDEIISTTSENEDLTHGDTKENDLKDQKVVDRVDAKAAVKTENQISGEENCQQVRDSQLSAIESDGILDADIENSIDATVPNDALIVDNTKKNKSSLEEQLEQTDELMGEILNDEKNVVDKNNEISQRLFKNPGIKEETETEHMLNTIEEEMNTGIIHIIGGKDHDDDDMDAIFEKSEEVTLDTHESTKDEIHEASVNEEDFVNEEEKENAGDIQDKVDNKIIVIVEKEGEMYKCGICGKIFARLSYLKLHIPKHSEKFKCQKCLKHFTRNETLQKHKCGAVKTLLEEPLDEIAKMHEVDGRELYQCMKCSENFDTQIEVIAHYVIHSSENISCLKCNKTLQSDETLEEHNCAANESEDKFPCDLCSQSFTSAKYLHRHLIMHTDLFKCKKCDFCFSRKDSLQKHVMKCCPEFADSYKIHYCSLCYRVFSTKAGLLNHVSKCKWVRCEKCSRVFNGQEDMDSHECYEGQKVPEGSGIEFSCGKCGKTFLNNYYLKQHQAIHKESFQCGICNKYMKSQDDLLAHARICEMVQKIRADGQVKCDLCEEFFKKPKDLRLHYQIHTHPYSCMKCNKRFVKESGLLVHNCKSDNTFECKKCYKEFTSSRFLNRHMEIDHGKELFKCKDCNKGFSRRLKFQNHICKLDDGTFGNKGVKDKLMCPTCGKTLSSRSNLNKHMIAHGDKQFRCMHCGKHFHYENYLRDHISSVHLNLHSYQCSDCGKKMKSKTGLIAHVKQFHRGNTESYTCEVCGKTFKQKGNL